MIYGVDVDGVLSQTTEAVIDYLRDMHDHDMSIEQVTSFYWEDWCPARWVVDEVVELFRSEVFYEGLEPVTGAVDGVQALRSNARSVVAITSRPLHCREATEDWLMAWGFDIRRVVCAQDKVAAANHYGVKVMVEDAQHHALALAEARIQVYLLDYPWNQNLPAHPLIRRVSGWLDIIESERRGWKIDDRRVAGITPASFMTAARLR